MGLLDTIKDALTSDYEKEQDKGGTEDLTIKKAAQRITGRQAKLDAAEAAATGRKSDGQSTDSSQ